MEKQAIHDSLIGHLTRTTRLNPNEAQRVIEDVLAYFSETTEEFVRRRHRELRLSDATNETIFTQISVELASYKVSPPQLSARQLRRMIYG